MVADRTCERYMRTCESLTCCVGERVIVALDKCDVLVSHVPSRVV